MFLVPKTSISLDLFSVLQILVVLTMFLLLFVQKAVILKDLINEKNFRILTLIYIFGIFSTLWSSIPLFSLFMAFQNLVFLAVIFYLVSHNNTFDNLESLLIKSVIIFIGISAAGDFIRNGPNFIFNWHNLKTGGLSGMLLCYSLGELLNIRRYNLEDYARRQRLRRVALFSSFILILSTSSGANVAFIIGAISLIFTSRNRVLRLAAGLIILSLFLLPTLIESIVPFVFPGKSVSGITTLGFRITLWESFWELIKQKPIFGWGYATIERIGDQYNIDAHNSFIGIVGGLGFVGGIMLFLYIVEILLLIYKRRDYPGHLGLFAALMCMTANSNTFGFLSSKTSILTLGFFLLVSISYWYYLFLSSLPNGEN